MLNYNFSNNISEGSVIDNLVLISNQSDFKEERRILQNRRQSKNWKGLFFSKVNGVQYLFVFFFNPYTYICVHILTYLTCGYIWGIIFIINQTIIPFYPNYIALSRGIQAGFDISLYLYLYTYIFVGGPLTALPLDTCQFCMETMPVRRTFWRRWMPHWSGCRLQSCLMSESCYVMGVSCIIYLVGINGHFGEEMGPEWKCAVLPHSFFWFSIIKNSGTYLTHPNPVHGPHFGVWFPLEIFFLKFDGLGGWAGAGGGGHAPTNISRGSTRGGGLGGHVLN